MKRFQYVEREIIEHSDRVKIIAKSSNKCCRCGKGLTLSTMTVDHYIPLSQGGSNNIENLIPLCKDCNKKKDSKIMHPSEYAAYLLPKYRKELIKAYDNFQDDYKWYEPTNLCKDHKFYVSYPLGIDSMRGHRIRKNNAIMIADAGRAVVEKAVYSDMDELYMYTKKYMEKLGLDTSELWECMSDNFIRGCYYMIKNASGLIGIIPLCIDKITIGNDLVYTISLKGLPVLYQKPQYEYAIKEALEQILGELARLNSRHLITISVRTPVKDTFAQRVFDEYAVAFDDLDNDDDWTGIIGLAIFETKEEFSANNSDQAMTKGDMIKDFKYVSDCIERLFGVPSLNKRAENFQITKKKTVAEKNSARKYRSGQRVSADIKKANNRYKRAKMEIREADHEEDLREYIG